MFHFKDTFDQQPKINLKVKSASTEVTSSSLPEVTKHDVTSTTSSTDDVYSFHNDVTKPDLDEDNNEPDNAARTKEVSSVT